MGRNEKEGYERDRKVNRQVGRRERREREGMRKKHSIQYIDDGHMQGKERWR
jgi:hypothetical protein